MKKITRTHCTGDCPGRPQLARVSQAFTRRGSKVEVIISRIPASVCPICGQSFVEEETAQRVEVLLRPFHGIRDATPALPAAKVYIDFEEAGKKKKAA
ncbi:MAG: hypothetical protein FJ147_05185 [Deltaproteobacteria bacterium]|nr:hypothetical protein [Deltaproteobacteria bacterium]